MSSGATVPAPGFADPGDDAQRGFRAILEALAHPLRPYPLAGPPAPPPSLGAGLAAVALTLLEQDTTFWRAVPSDDAGAATADAWLAFHTGAPRVGDPGAAAFVFCDARSRPPLHALALGSDEAPHLSATVVLDVRGAGPDPNADGTLTGRGPGIDGSVTVSAPWADDAFLGEWADNHARFPRGVDLLAVDERSVVGLPRTTRLDRGEA